MDTDTILEFWFAETRREPGAIQQRNRIWFSADRDFDAQIRQQFSSTLHAAEAGQLRRWQLSPHGTLALILVFDQFTRNIHRGTARAFSCDHRALALCRDGLVHGIDRQLDIVERLFFYLPLEHAEDLDAQQRSVSSFQGLHDEAGEDLRAHTAVALKHAVEHYDLIAQFGRFPHRNLILDRVSSSAELDWLRDHGGAYGQA